MISIEPTISIGIIEKAKEVRGGFNGRFTLPDTTSIEGEFSLRVDNGIIICINALGREVARNSDILFTPLEEASFTLQDVMIGINFHWERKERQTFKGLLQCIVTYEGITVVNEIGIEQYLQSVISSEMSAEAPLEFLKAHAITSRSWLAAMLERRKRSSSTEKGSARSNITPNEIIRWYDREDHTNYDVCADDHCQRYQGITKLISNAAAQAVESTRGMFLTCNNRICDARFSKACGGRTELFEHCWEETPIPYLQSISDSKKSYAIMSNESDILQWVHSSPDVYCNTADGKFLRMVLPSYDQETTDFFRWKVEYSQGELQKILLSKSGIDFGPVRDIVPLQRGPSGRIYKLQIVGTKRTITVGKELEIRRWLSKTHLYSSAFVVTIDRKSDGTPERFIFHGAGWGHGVGLCQIGAAVMAAQGLNAEEIVKHYFLGVEIEKLY